jgi:membrane protein
MRQQAARVRAGAVPALGGRWGSGIPLFIYRALRGLAGIVVRAIKLYMADHCGTYAAAIAYYAIFSLVPLSLVTLSIVGLVVNEHRIVDFVFEQVPLQQTQSVRNSVEEIVARAHDVSAAGLGIGAAVLVWSGSGIFSAVRRGLNAASHRKKVRPYWHGKLLDFTLIPCLGLLILLSVVATTVAQIIIQRAAEIGPLHLDANLAVQVTSYALAALSSFVMFLLLYRFVSGTRPSWGEAVAGATFATILFEAAKNLYALIFNLSPFTRDTALYAGFGTAMAFLLWTFINASILLLGAEFGRAAFGAGKAGDMAAERFAKPFRW